MTIVLLMLIVVGQPFISVASDRDQEEGIGPGSRATIYGNHPRVLVRDVDWNGGLSVSDLRSRCQVGTPWWNQCQRVTNAGSGVERAIPTFAMKWLIDENAADADQAITLMLAVDEVTPDQQALSDLALGFDWLYNYTGFDAGEKTTVIGKLDTLATNVEAYIADRHIWSRFMGEVGSVGLAGLALYGDHANAQGYITFAEEKLADQMEALEYSNGSWAEGFRYLAISRLPQFLEFLEGYRTATSPSVDLFDAIENDQGDWLRKMLYFHIYNLMPYGEISRVGDIAQGTMKDNYRRNLELMVTRLNDSAGAEFLEILEGTSNAQPTYYTGYAFKHILWYDPSVDTDGLKDLPRAMWFGPGSYDQVVFRTGWEEDDTVITFRSGDGFTGHAHLDNGAFTIARGEALAIDSGMYANWGTEHRENYYTRTIAHNAMTIDRGWEQFQSPYFGGWLANDGGQRVNWYYQGSSQQDDLTLDDYMANKYAGTHFETGNITAFDTGDEFDYVFGDYTNAYNNPLFSVNGDQRKVTYVSRELVSLGPDWVVVVDHVHTFAIEHDVRFNLHMINEPTVSGNVIGSEAGATHYDGQVVTFQQNGAYLHSRTVFPDTHRTIKRGGAGYEYWVANANRDAGASPDPLAGNWRIEVKDEHQMTDHLFLHVMNIQGPGGSSSMPYTKSIDENGVMGAYFDDTVTIFSKTRQTYNWASVNLTEEGETRFHAFNMEPDTYYPVLNVDTSTGWFEVTGNTSTENGTLSFTVDLTGNNQVIIGDSPVGDLSLKDMGRAPAEPNEGDNITFYVTLDNPTRYRFDDVTCNWSVEFFNGFPEVGGELLGAVDLDAVPQWTQDIIFNTTLEWDPFSQVIVARINMTEDCGFNDTDMDNNEEFLSVYVNAYPVPIIEAVDHANTETSVVLDASDSYDMEGAIKEFTWNFDDGHVGDGRVVNHTFELEGNYTVTLTVKDLKDVTNSTTHNISITVRPRVAPVPDFEIGTEDGSGVGDITTNFTFVSTTYDPDNITMMCSWDFGDGVTSSGENATHRFDDDGIYNVTMTILWNVTESASVSKLLTVQNLPPVPRIEVDMNETFKGIRLSFDAFSTQDPDDEYGLLSFVWDFGDGNNGTGDSAIHIYTKSDLFTVTLTVIDDDGAMAIDTVDILVKNRGPKADIKASATTLEWNEMLELNASGSSDADGRIVNYTWDLGDNTSLAHGMSVEHRFSKEGYYIITLTVMDEDGGIDNATITVYQSPKPPPLPPPPPPPPPDDDMASLYMILGAMAGIIVVIAVMLVLFVMRSRRARGQRPPQGPEGDLDMGEMPGPQPGPQDHPDVGPGGGVEGPPVQEEVMVPDQASGPIDEVPEATASSVENGSEEGREDLIE